MTIAAIVIPPKYAMSEEAFPSFEEWREQNRPSRELRSTLIVTGPAIKGRKLHILVGIKNVSKNPVYFSYAMGSSWIHGISHIPIARGADDFRLGGSLQFGSTHTAIKDREICHVPGAVYMLRPGGEMFRDAQIDLEGVPEGKVRISVDYKLVKVTPGVKCEKAHIYNGRAEAEIFVHSSIPTNGGGKIKNAG